MSRIGLLIVVLLLGAGALAGCHDHELPDIDCGAVLVPSYGEVALLSGCTVCHSSQRTGAMRTGAPVGIDYDTYDDAVANAEHGAAAVYSGIMPPVGSVPQEAKDQFYAWALCGTPP